MEYGSVEKKGPGEIVDSSQGPLHPSPQNGSSHWNERSSKGGGRSAWVNKELLADLRQKENVQEVEVRRR